MAASSAVHSVLGAIFVWERQVRVGEVELVVAGNLLAPILVLSLFGARLSQFLPDAGQGTTTEPRAVEGNSLHTSSTGHASA